MGLFSNSDNDILRKYNLEGLPQQDLEIVRQIVHDLSGNKLISLNTALSLNTIDSAKLGYLSALVQQNWIIINQLSRISSLLEKQSFPETSNSTQPVSVWTDAQIPQAVQISEAGKADFSIEAVKRYLSVRRVKYVDNTASGGMLWITFDKSISDWIEGITINGNKPKYTHGAGMLDGKPGWFVSA